MKQRIVRLGEYEHLVESDFSKLLALIGSTIPDYYNVLFNALGSHVSIVKALLTDSESELGNPTVALDDNGRVIGLINTTSLAESGNKQLYTLKMLMSRLDDLSREKTLQTLEVRLRPPKIVDDSLYISMISVIDLFQGKDVARALLDTAIAKARIQSFELLSLHVATSNTRAINFYLKYDFREGVQDNNYKSMFRAIQ